MEEDLAWTIDLRGKYKIHDTKPVKDTYMQLGHKWHSVAKDASGKIVEDPKCEHCGNFKSELIGSNASAWVCISCAVYVGEE